MPACNPRGARPTFHRFRLAAMTTSNWHAIRQLSPAALEPEVGFEPMAFRLRDGCSASIWTAPDGSGLLTLDGPSIQTGPDGCCRIVRMIKGQQRDRPGRVWPATWPGAQSSWRLPLVVPDQRAALEVVHERLLGGHVAWPVTGVAGRGGALDPLVAAAWSGGGRAGSRGPPDAAAHGASRPRRRHRRDTPSCRTSVERTTNRRSRSRRRSGWPSRSMSLLWRSDT